MRIYRLPLAALLCTSFLSAAPGATELRTDGSPRSVELASGVTLQVAPRSTGTLFSDHVVLDSGALRIGHFDRFAVDVRELQLKAQDAATQAVVRLNGDAVEVASVGGPVDVLAGSAMLARVVAGSRMSFRQSGASPGARPRHRSSDKHIMLWMIGGTAAAALVIGVTAAAQGKSPF